MHKSNKTIKLDVGKGGEGQLNGFRKSFTSKLWVSDCTTENRSDRVFCQIHVQSNGESLLDAGRKAVVVFLLILMGIRGVPSQKKTHLAALAQLAPSSWNLQTGTPLVFPCGVATALPRDFWDHQTSENV